MTGIWPAFARLNNGGGDFSHDVVYNNERENRWAWGYLGTNCDVFRSIRAFTYIFVFSSLFVVFLNIKIVFLEYPPYPTYL